MRSFLFFIVVLLTVCLLAIASVVKSFAYEKLQTQKVALDSPRTTASILIGYQHQKFFVFDNQAIFGAYFKAEKCQFEGGCENAVVEIYKVPDGKTANEVLPTFSNGGAELIKVFPKDNYVFLGKGEYIVKLIGPKDMARINLTWNPRRVP